MGKSVTHPNSLKVKLYNYVAIPCLSGFCGFTIFFTTLVIAKWLGSLVGSVHVFKVEIEDVGMSIIGFLFFFVIRFLKNFDKKDK